jgi:hypothetical protein
MDHRDGIWRSGSCGRALEFQDGPVIVAGPSLDPPRRRQHALLDFLASKLIRRKSQQEWPSEATLPRRARRSRRRMSNPPEGAIEAHGLERWSQLAAVRVRLVQGGARRTLTGQQGVLARDLNGALPWES